MAILEISDLNFRRVVQDKNIQGGATFTPNISTDVRAGVRTDIKLTIDGSLAERRFNIDGLGQGAAAGAAAGSVGGSVWASAFVGNFGD